MRLTIVVFNDFIHVETITAGVLKLPIKCLQPDLSPPAGKLKEIQLSENQVIYCHSEGIRYILTCPVYTGRKVLHEY